MYLVTNGWTFLLGSTSLVHNSGIPSTGTWYHIAATYDGSNQKLYINGELVDTESMTGSIPTNNNPLYIGGIDANRFFDGKIGQVRVYSSALSQDDIRQNYNFTKPSYPNGNDASLTSLTHNPSSYFTYDSGSDKAVITNAKSKGLVPNSSTDITTLMWIRIHSASALLYILTGRNQG